MTTPAPHPSEPREDFLTRLKLRQHRLPIPSPYTLLQTAFWSQSPVLMLGPDERLARLLDLAVNTPGGNQASRTILVGNGPWQPLTRMDQTMVNVTADTPSSAWKHASLIRAPNIRALMTSGVLTFLRKRNARPQDTLIVMQGEWLEDQAAALAIAEAYNTHLVYLSSGDRIDLTHAVRRDGRLHAHHAFGTLIDWTSRHLHHTTDEVVITTTDSARPLVWIVPTD